MLKILRSWTLPISMFTGAIVYLVFSQIDGLNPIKPHIYSLISILTPSLIFAQLLITFCKISFRDLLPVRWHGWLLLIQLLTSLSLVALLFTIPMEEEYRALFEGAMVCLICPTATAAAVITGKLGGSAPSLTTYTLLSNLLAALMVPLLFPLVEPHAGITFMNAFFVILRKVFPLLLFPFFLALILKRFIPFIHKFLAGLKDMAFYLWAVALTIVTGQTVKSLVNSEASIMLEAMIALAGLTTCVVQFYLGRRIGGRYGDKISAGQALGQKNTILAIWMTYTYLNPLASVAPGSYVLWQNFFNSYQLWRKTRE